MIINYSSGTQKAFAALSVTFPDGANCTCSNGDKTLRAKDNEHWLFQLPSGGEWTLAISDSEHEEVTKTIMVERYQAQEVKLSYWSGELYKDGDEFTDITGGWELTQVTGATNNSAITKNSDNINFTTSVVENRRNAYGQLNTVKAIDLTSVTKLILVYKAEKASHMTFAPQETKTGQTTTSKQPKSIAVTPSAEFTTLELDVTDVTGEYYVSITATANANADITIKEIRAEGLE